MLTYISVWIFVIRFIYSVGHEKRAILFFDSSFSCIF